MESRWIRSNVVTIGSILLGALLLLYPVLINRYPLVCADSGTYIKSGFLGRVPLDRPIMYGLLVRYLSLTNNLFIFIAAQAVIVSSVIYLACSQLVIRSGMRLPAYWICMGLIVCFTGVPWFTSWMMPDIYSGVSALLLLVLLFSSHKLKQNAWLIVLYYILALTHLSNILTHLLFVMTMIVVVFIYHFLRHNFALSLQRLLWICVIVVFNYIVLATINFALERKIFISRGTTIFVTAKLCDYGLLNEYLNRHCKDENYRVCAWKDSIQPDLATFLWSPDGVLFKMGETAEQDKEFARINKSILTDPELLKKFVLKGMTGSARQFASINTGRDFMNFSDTGSAPFRAVKGFFRKDLYRFVNSRQNSSTLEFPFALLNTVQYCILFLLSVLVVILMLLSVQPKTHPVIISGFLLLIFNALVCAFLSTVEDRYQGRMIWLFVVIVIIELVNNRGALQRFFRYRKHSRK